MIHPTAIIDPEARLAPNVRVGALAIIEGPAQIGAGCIIEPGAQIVGRVHLGEGTRIGRGAVIGGDPQDAGFDPATASGVRIGSRNRIREHVTIHRSTQPDGFTEIGDENFLMVGAHLGHDAKVGNGNVLANSCLVAGHVEIGNRCFIGGGAVFHQFIHVGDLAVVQGNGSFSKDIPPFCAGVRTNRLGGLNAIGLRRAGLPPDERAEIKRLFDLLFRSGKPLGDAIQAASEESWKPAASAMLDFVRHPSRKGVCTRIGDDARD